MDRLPHEYLGWRHAGTLSMYRYQRATRYLNRKVVTPEQNTASQTVRLFNGVKLVESIKEEN